MILAYSIQNQVRKIMECDQTTNPAARAGLDDLMFALSVFGDDRCRPAPVEVVVESGAHDIAVEASR